MLVSELVEDMNLPLHFTLAEDGQEALDILKNNDGSTNGHMPDLVILDLNLPKVNGFEVLKYMRSMPDLLSIPVVVLTGSLRKEDEVKVRKMGASGYCIKPSTVEEMARSAMCLRNHLESLYQSDRKSSGSGPSAMVNLDLSRLDLGDRLPCLYRASGSSLAANSTSLGAGGDEQEFVKDQGYNSFGPKEP